METYCQIKDCFGEGYKEIEMDFVEPILEDNNKKVLVCREHYQEFHGMTIGEYVLGDNWKEKYFDKYLNKEAKP
jgi:hypothetical protein